MITQYDVNEAYELGLRNGKHEIYRALRGLDGDATCRIGQFRDSLAYSPTDEKKTRSLLGLDPVTIARRRSAPTPPTPVPAVRATPAVAPVHVAAQTTLRQHQDLGQKIDRGSDKGRESAAAMGRRIAEQFNDAEQTETDDSAAAMGSRIAAQFEGRKGVAA